MKTEEVFLKKYFNLVSQDEVGMIPYVCIGQKGNILYFIKPVNVITKISHNYKEKSGFTIFAYDKVNHKRTQGIQASFLDSNKLNVDAISKFDLNYISNYLTNFEFKTSITYIYRHNIFAQSAKKYLNRA